MGLIAPDQIIVPSNEGQMNPKSYTCADHLELVEEEDGRSDVRTIWAHGYYSALKGVDENSPTLNAQKLLEFSQRLESKCSQEPKTLFIRVLKKLD